MFNLPLYIHRQFVGRCLVSALLICSANILIPVRGLGESFEYTGGTWTTLTAAGLGLPSTTTSFAPYGVNNLGDIVGTYATSDYSGLQGFVSTATGLQTVDVPGADSTIATGMNNLGEVVGYYDTANSGWFAFTDVGGVFTAVTPTYGLPMGVNDSGDIAGNLGGADSNQLFLYANGSVSTPFGSLDAWGTDINNSGQIVGSLGTGPYTVDGFVASPVNSTYELDLLACPTAAETYPEGITSTGEVTGYYMSAVGSSPSGFIEEGNSCTSLSFPGSGDTEPHGINDLGTIVGTYNQFTPASAPEGGSTAEFVLVDLAAVGIGTYAFGLKGRRQERGASFKA